MRMKSGVRAVGLLAGAVLSAAVCFAVPPAVGAFADAQPALRYAGDINGVDGITVTDARAILRAAVLLDEIPTEDLPYADADGSGVIDENDSRLALRASVELEEKTKHSFSVKVEKEASCTEAGSLHGVCSDCGKSLELVIPKKQHQYKVTEKTEVTCLTDGKTVMECTLCGNTEETVFSAKGHDWKKATLTSPKTCSSCGETVTGWTEIGEHKYYFNKDGSMAKNRIVGSYYVGKDGARAEGQAISLAVKFVNANSSSSLSNYERLKQCYNAAVKAFKYKTVYGTPAASELPSCAVSMFTSGVGNCYCYASSFAYIARVLGYDSAVEEGSINPGGYVSVHGWTKVKYDGKWLICDVVQQRYRSQHNYFMKTYSSYPFTLYKGPICYLTVENGTDTWSN